jgi:predicted O-linked N-acetylglucosamine transferase (SPINDLY family)
MTDDLFLSSVKQLTEKNMSVGEVIDAAERLRAAGSVDLAGQVYKLWTKLNADSPFAHAIHYNYAVLLSNINDLPAAKENLERCIELNPDFAPAYINLGGVLERMGMIQQAVSQWIILTNRLDAVTGSAIEHKTSAFKQISRILESHDMGPMAERAMWMGLDLFKYQPDLIQHYIALRLAQCEWPAVAPWERVEKKLLIRGIGPLSMGAYTDDPLLQLASSWNYAKNVVGYPYAEFQDNHWLVQAAMRHGRRRIAYVSSDLRGHAVGLIMAQMFEFHDRSEFEIFIYYCGPSMPDAIQERIKASAEHWIDINGLDTAAFTRRIMDDGIDIVVDINGYTKFARTETLALRPAPIIVNWLGFPGSMGSPYHHYIIADEWIIPKEYEIYYSEKVMRLPCYQPNDRKRAASERRPTRQETGLPEDAVVFCCFNGPQKITRFMFERWMTILREVPDSVLWLFEGSKLTNQNLKDYAQQQGISPERLIFAPRKSNPDHLARIPLADIFLDTTPYNAHVTASDALWMGVPILTLSGRGFASRVCGSLSRSAGLPDMVCLTPEEYVERGITIGNDRAKIQELKDRLVAARDTCVLFDPALLVRHLEGLYRQMWKEFMQGQLPRPDLTNLDIYLELGCEEDHEGVEVLAIKDYNAWYRAKLARWHRYCSIREDSRLWTTEHIAQIERRDFAFQDDEPDEAIPLARVANG